MSTSTAKVAAKFKTTRPNTSIIPPDGEKLTFTGRYLVLDNPAHIDYVRSELKAFAGFIVEVPMDEVDVVDSIAEIKKQAIREFLEQQAAQEAKEHVSVAPAAPLMPSSTDSVAGMTAGPKVTISAKK